jgi:predicted adenine nucleotide alpha hydrolase (AANH) superfamily ATPase
MEYKSKKEKPGLLLHACCAVCASYPIEFLSDKFDTAVLFYNPNIYPPEEYWKRLEDLKRYSDIKKIRLAIMDYETSVFDERISGFEKEPEGGKRCEICFSLRLEKTAACAKEYGYDFFATTLTLSPHKKHKIINAIGIELADRHGVSYYESDFKKNNGFKIANTISKQFAFYRQNYCGCRHSIR